MLSRTPDSPPALRASGTARRTNPATCQRRTGERASWCLWSWPLVRWWMLLCLSSRQRRVFEESVEVAGEVAFEAAGGLAAALSFAGSTLDVVDGRSVCSASGEDDLVEGPVELSVAVAVESVADRLARRGGDWGGAGELGEGGLVRYAA